jgi:hypothetical protein
MYLFTIYNSKLLINYTFLILHLLKEINIYIIINILNAYFSAYYRVVSAINPEPYATSNNVILIK